MSGGLLLGGGTRDRSSTSTQPGFPLALTPQQQATDLLTMVHTVQADGAIRVAAIHTLQDADPNLRLDLISNVGGGLLGDDVFFNEIHEGLGVFTSRWVPKLAARALSRALGGSLVC